MCLAVNPDVKSLSKRIVWKVFDKPYGRIVSLFRECFYPLGKLITRDQVQAPSDGYLSHGIHVYLSKRAARSEAAAWTGAYIAKLKVDPKDFLAADPDGQTAAYHAATRIGKFIPVPRRKDGRFRPA